MFSSPHFETKTDDAGLFGVRKRSTRRMLLVTALAIVLISVFGSFVLPTYASGAYSRFVGTDQDRGSPTNSEGPTAGPGQLLSEKPSADDQRAGPSREDTNGRVPALRKGELLLTVPRLRLRNIRVPSGSTQARLDKEGIIRLASSGLPSYEGSNTYIVGHRIGFARTRIPYVFYKLGKLRPRDKILVIDRSGTEYTYEVYDQLTVPPTYVYATHPVMGKTVISLQTCTPIPSFEDRLVVRGELISVSSP